jgi:hypothetical protein
LPPWSTATTSPDTGVTEPQVVCCGSRSYFSSSQSTFSMAATLGTTKHTVQMIYLSHPIGTFWQPVMSIPTWGLDTSIETTTPLNEMLIPLDLWKGLDSPFSGSAVYHQIPLQLKMKLYPLCSYNHLLM